MGVTAVDLLGTRSEELGGCRWRVGYCLLPSFEAGYPFGRKGTPKNSSEVYEP